MAKSLKTIAGEVLAALVFGFCYAPVMAGMFGQWMNDEDMGHGVLVAPVVAWMLWRDRARLTAVERRPSAWGWLILVGAAALQAASALGAGLFAGALSLWFSVAGVTVVLFGFPMLRACLLAWLLCLFMLPKLAFVYNSATLGLQLVAARLAEGFLHVAGFAAAREGAILRIGARSVTVAEACNGIRYLLPLSFLSLVLAFLAGARRWMYFAMPVVAVAVSIGANAIRVAIATARPELLDGSAHAALGWVVFAGAFASLGAAYAFLARLTRGSHA